MMQLATQMRRVREGWDEGAARSAGCLVGIPQDVNVRSRPPLPPPTTGHAP